MNKKQENLDMSVLSIESVKRKYCPNCASNNLTILGTSSFDVNGVINHMSQDFECNYCNSLFNAEFKIEGIRMIEDNYDTKRMSMAKDDLEDELKTLLSKMKDARSLEDMPETEYLIDCLINNLRDYDSKDLAKDLAYNENRENDIIGFKNRE